MEQKQPKHVSAPRRPFRLALRIARGSPRSLYLRPVLPELPEVSRGSCLQSLRSLEHLVSEDRRFVLGLLLHAGFVGTGRAESRNGSRRRAVGRDSTGAHSVFGNLLDDVFAHVAGPLQDFTGYRTQELTNESRLLLGRT